MTLRPLAPRTLLRLVRLWAHARKQGRERGQFYRVGYYCRHCGTDVIWLVNAEGRYDWTTDRCFVQKHFEIVEVSREQSVYGRDRPAIGPMGGT